MGNVQTRHMDAKGMAHRRGSIYWNFRYSTMRRKDGEANTMMVFSSKITIKEWLELLDLQQYESMLKINEKVKKLWCLKQLVLLKIT